MQMSAANLTPSRRHNAPSESANLLVPNRNLLLAELGAPHSHSFRRRPRGDIALVSRILSALLNCMQEKGAEGASCGG